MRKLDYFNFVIPSSET
jgi:hypothetical protein